MAAVQMLDVHFLKEIVLQQAIYCGVPAAHHAFKLVSQLDAQNP
jgi:alkylhydroperoxidase/carboxymuconolactone decarboxylase family protein YurZ